MELSNNPGFDPSHTSALSVLTIKHFIVKRLNWQFSNLGLISSHNKIIKKLASIPNRETFGCTNLVVHDRDQQLDSKRSFMSSRLSHRANLKRVTKLLCQYYISNIKYLYLYKI